MTESELLQHEAEQAKAAIKATLSRMQETLKDSADLRAWAAEYPWPMVGAAAVAGFIAASALTPTSRQSEHDKWAAYLNRVLAEGPEGLESRTAQHSKSRSMLSSMFSSVLGSLATAVQSAVVAAATAKAQQPEPEPSQNGHEPAASES